MINVVKITLSSTTVSFFNYSNIYTTSHSPFFFLLLHLFEEALGNRDLMRFFFLHICLLIPFLFYICLIKQYAQSKKNYLIYISLLLFFSPYYRSLSIWPGSENLSLIFLILSFLFFLNYKTRERVFHFCLKSQSSLVLEKNYCHRRVYLITN